jgi:hypothetical protein
VASLRRSLRGHVSGLQRLVVLGCAFLNRKLDQCTPETAKCRPRSHICRYQLAECLGEFEATWPSRQTKHKFSYGSCLLMSRPKGFRRIQFDFEIDGIRFRPPSPGCPRPPTWSRLKS